MFTSKDDYKFVNFFSIPHTAFQTVKYNDKIGEVKQYENLFQIILQNKSIIFNIDKSKKRKVQEREVDFIDDF